MNAIYKIKLIASRYLPAALASALLLGIGMGSSFGSIYGQSSAEAPTSATAATAAATIAAPPQSEKLKSALVSLRASARIYDPTSPSSQPRIVSNHGTAFIIAPQLILTELALVRGAVSIELSHSSWSEPVTARVRSAVRDANMAILEVVAESALEGWQVERWRFGDARLGEELRLFGYSELHSTQLSMHSHYVSSLDWGKIAGSDIDRRRRVLIERAVELPPGFAGGVAINQNDEIVGILHSRSSRPLESSLFSAADLQRIVELREQSPFLGFAQPGALVSPLIHDDLKQHLQSADGFVVDRLTIDSPLRGKIEIGDVIETFNRENLSARQITLEQHFAEQTAKRATLRIRRNNQPMEIEIELQSDPSYDYQRQSLGGPLPFFAGCGLYFRPLDYDLMQSSGYRQRTDLAYHYHYRQIDRLLHRGEEQLILVERLEDPCNATAVEYLGLMLERFNGEPVRNLDQLARLWRENRQRYIVLQFVGLTRPLILEREGLLEAERRISERYQPQEAGRVR